MSELMEGQVSIFDLDTSFLKMSQEFSQVTKVRTSAKSSKKSQKSKTKMPLFLDLRTANGKTQDASWVTDIASHGESLIVSIGESHKGEGEFASLQTSMAIMHLISFLTLVNPTEQPNEITKTHLSQILEQNADPKYNLSAKACQGILNRAEKRGKVLPTMLKVALLQQIERELSATE